MGRRRAACRSPRVHLSGLVPTVAAARRTAGIAVVAIARIAIASIAWIAIVPIPWSGYGPLARVALYPRAAPQSACFSLRAMRARMSAFCPWQNSCRGKPTRDRHEIPACRRDVYGTRHLATPLHLRRIAHVDHQCVSFGDHLPGPALRAGPRRWQPPAYV